MTFRYKKYAPKILRPVIPIEISFRGKTVRYETLVDSGADNNIFHSELTQLLGINLTDGTEKQISGINGQPEPYWTHKVDLIIGGHLHKEVEVGFKHLATDGYGVVGQLGFFDLYIVKFDLKKEELELKSRT